MKKRIKKKNGIAKALQHPSFKQQVVPDKRERFKKKTFSEFLNSVPRPYTKED